jgi:alcohol dehydrogenase
MKIHAAVLEAMGAEPPYAHSQPLSWQELDLQEPGEGEVLVKIRAAGLCHSDLSVMNGTRPRPTPMALGHEAAATVEKLGPGVTDLEPGDHVVMVFVPSCGHCPACSEGRPALCEPGNSHNKEGTLLSGARRLSRGGEPVHHHLGVSCFAEYAVCSRWSLVKIDREVPFEHAALFGCAVLTGVGAAVNTANVRPGQSVAVVGLGGVGLAALLGARAAGAEQIVAVDLLPEKLELARRLGATDTVLAGRDETAEEVRAATRGGVHAAIETAGVVRAVELAFAITRIGGTTVTAGLSHPDTRISVHPVTLVAEERTLKGSYVGSCIPVRDVDRYVRLYKAGQLPVDQLLTDTLRPQDLNAAFDKLDAGQAVRQVLLVD